MNIRETVFDIGKFALLVGLIYAVVNWKDDNLLGNGVQDFAEQSCIDEIKTRINASRISVYAVSENNTGFVVRTTVALAKDRTAKVTCLTNRHGGIKDIEIEER